MEKENRIEGILTHFERQYRRENKKKDLCSIKIKGVYSQIVPILQIVRDLKYAINLLRIFG